MAPGTSNGTSNLEREHERQKYRARLATALTEEDDPLAAYHQFVQWTIKNYGENNPRSGLKDLLKEATTQFKGDPLYKTDLRYLKLWALYARQVDKASALSIYASLLANDIGTSYSALYEDYASLLESAGKREEVDSVYRKGIKKAARPLERLKMRYRDFQSRCPPPTSSSNASSSSPSLPSAKSESSRSNSSTSRIADNSPSSSKTSPSYQGGTFKSTAASRYALMLAPPAPGKRPERFRCNMSLLFTDDGVEYSIQEARARSMGLLGKKWGPPPPSEFTCSSTSASASTSSSCSSSALVNFNDGGGKTSRRKAHGRKSLLAGAEPTFTINTKEALADVFGMYNSPDKTSKLAVPGSKHAPLKKVDPVTPVVPPRVTILKENENSHNTKTPTLAFRPFVDENAQSNANRTPGVKFTPFVDPGQQNIASLTPRPVLTVKETAPSTNLRSENATSNTISKHEEKVTDPVFSKVFTPAGKGVPLAPLRDVFTDDHGKPVPKPKAVLTHERAKSQHDAPSSTLEGAPCPALIPFKDENSRTPFKVFTRPPDQNAQNSLTPKAPGAAFTPFVDPKPPTLTPFKDTALTFKPFVDSQGLQQPSVVVEEQTTQSPEIQDADKEPLEMPEHEPEQDEEDYSNSYEDDESQIDRYEPLAPEQLPQEHYEEGNSYQEVPLGGRFGQFNVLTPITERTFEFTSSTREGGTPNEDYSGRRAANEAAEVAVRLAAELQQGEGQSDEGEDDEDRLRHRPHIEPLHLSAGHFPPQADSGVVEIVEKAGALSLLDTLTLSSKFRPSNPCNPFEPSILSALLSRIPTDPHFYDLRSENINTLANVQRFVKNSRKTSSGSNGVLQGTFPLTLQGHKFLVTEKLGEGGFGSVFKARDVGMKLGGEGDGNDFGDEDFVDDFDDEDFADSFDDENASMVAIKIVKPRNVWEYHVLRRLHSTMPPFLRKSLVLPHALYAFGDESYLVLDLCPQGMLLNVINNAAAAGVSQAGACLDELLVVFFTIELLRLVEAMHSAGFIHGDLKIDNCLLRLEEVPGGAAAWSGTYQATGEGGWSYKGLKIIDFGRTIDTRLFPPGQQFTADWPTDERDCLEIRENRPWTYQTDYFGLAGIIYCMLFGKYIQASSITTYADEFGVQRNKITTPFKRYWQIDSWNRLFDALLNPSLVLSNGDLPICDALAGLRREMEQWLQSNCNRTSNTLKGLLKKVELSCYKG